MTFESYLMIFVISLGVTLVAYPMLIPFLHKLKYGQTVSEYMPSQAKKTGTPTMGGIIFIAIPIIIQCILHPTSFQNSSVILVMLAYIGYGIIGFIDDYIIVVTKNNAGLSPRNKFLAQLFLAVVFYMLFQSSISTAIAIPLTSFQIELGPLYVLFVLLMFASCSNAVNLTDGMDGLAGGTSILALTPFVLFAIHDGQYELACFIVAIIASLVGYLRYNFFPAKIFMGDCGALALGGVLAALGLVLKRELVVILIGLVFVVETASVILQVFWVKKFGHRIFKCSPIHYHFEQSGMKEKNVVFMFYAIGAVCAALGYFIGL